ncbi:hypothetical protein T484DRAFT_1837357 [Baffinella frigidus]|nr:hypothetical protein T484DRAFT_1837357 [Cryptophyta sp. CCMP2293]
MEVARMLEPAAALQAMVDAGFAQQIVQPPLPAPVEPPVPAAVPAPEPAPAAAPAPSAAPVPYHSAIARAMVQANVQASQQAQQQAAHQQAQTQNQAPPHVVAFFVTIPPVAPQGGEGKGGGVAGGTLEATFRAGDYVPRFDLRAVCTALWTPGSHPDQIKKRMNKARAILFEGMLVERPGSTIGETYPGRKSMGYGIAALGLAFLAMQTHGFSKEQRAGLSAQLSALVNLAPLPAAAKKGGAVPGTAAPPWELEKGVLRKLLVAAEAGSDEGLREVAAELRTLPRTSRI